MPPPHLAKVSAQVSGCSMALRPPLPQLRAGETLGPGRDAVDWGSHPGPTHHSRVHLGATVIRYHCQCVEVTFLPVNQAFDCDHTLWGMQANITVTSDSSSMLQLDSAIFSHPTLPAMFHSIGPALFSHEAVG